LKCFFMRIIKEHHKEGPMRSNMDCVVWPNDSTYCLTCGPCWSNQQLTLCLSIVCEYNSHLINPCWLRQSSPWRVRHQLHSDKADCPKKASL
jgi:hypothetical protein